MSEKNPLIGWPTFHHATLAARTAPCGSVAKPLPIIVDSDPGLDDALALALAVARPELNLLAVTSVGGNADVHHCTENALRLLHLLQGPWARSWYVSSVAPLSFVVGLLLLLRAGGALGACCVQLRLQAPVAQHERPTRPSVALSMLAKALRVLVGVR